MLSAAGRLPFVVSHQAFTHARLRTCVAGLEFPNPVGLAAGCDKNGKALPIWPRFGFGFVEAGTITAQPQPGNARPRIFRVPKHQALINRLGFNSEGSTVVANRLAILRRGRPLPIPIGINIGKTKLVTGDDATLEDYRTSYRRLAPLADFMVVNVSSPNTPGLRQWQEKPKLHSLLTMLMNESRLRDERFIARDNGAIEDRPPSNPRAPEHGMAASRTESDAHREGGVAGPPLFLKISPDMADADMADVVEVALDLGIAGIIATNTTTARPESMPGSAEAGGLSGRPLCDRANEVIRFLYRLAGKGLTLIGVGGIFTAEDVYQRLQSGASLVQLYTAIIYEGPLLPRTLNEGLLQLMERDGVKTITELVGKAL